jgi:hypothetical protein
MNARVFFWGFLSIAVGTGGCVINAGSGGSGASGDEGGSSSSAPDTTSVGGAGGADPAAIDEACAAVASAACLRMDTCSNGNATYLAYGDIATCNAREKAACVLRATAPETSSTPDRLGACALAYGDYGCADLLDRSLPDACMPAPGGLDEGSACRFSDQCATGFCDVAQGAACGECAPVPVAGDACTDDEACGEGTGLRCDVDEGVCAVPAPLDAACSSDVDCEVGLTCLGASASGQGSCRPAGVEIGAACGESAPHGAGCEADLGLNCTSGSCTSLAYASAGETCGPVVEGLAVCADGGTCSEFGGAPTCTPAAAEGEACDLFSGPSCVAPARCVVVGFASAGVCRLPDASACE